jgi:hypothetical protein
MWRRRIGSYCTTGYFKHYEERIMAPYIERGTGGGGDDRPMPPHGDPQRTGYGHEAKSNQEQRMPYAPGQPGSGGTQSGMTQGGTQPGNMQTGGLGQQEGNGLTQPGAPGAMGQPGQAGWDYRDDLRTLLDKAHSERGLTRYRLCKQMGIDSGTLSNVLAKRRHFSLEKLEQILHLLGYRLSFTPVEGQTS